MGQILQICPCPCLKAKKKQFSYDVHQETFQMDDGQGLPKSSQNRYDKQFKEIKSEALTDEVRSDTKMLPQDWQYVEQEKKPMSENDKVDEQKKYIEQKIQNQSRSQESNRMEIEKELQQQKLKVQEKVQKEEKFEQQPKMQKPKNPNILSTKKIKKKYNPQDYRFLNEKGQFRVKKVDSIKEQQFDIDGCKDCFFFIFDITANVYIDNTQNCFIFIAPCESTIFVRNCKKMYIVAASKQFRTVDCENCHFSIYCKSQPVIQSSSNMVFSSFNAPTYRQLGKQFSKTKLEIWNNHWSQIHNFTKKEGKKDHSLVRKLEWNLELELKQHQIPWERAFKQAELQHEGDIIVPFIKGDYQSQQSQTQVSFSKKALIVFNSKISKDNDQINKALPYISLNEKQLLILKANHNKLSQMGNDPLVALLIVYSQEELLEGLNEKTKILITDEEEIKEKSSAYFISFGDQH